MHFKPGQVVLCHFPFDEPPHETKARPGLIMKCLPEEGKYRIAQITTKDKSYHCDGYHVVKNTKEALDLGLSEDSFINLSNIKSLPEIAIIRAKGRCSFLKALEDICLDNGIKI